MSDWEAREAEAYLLRMQSRGKKKMAHPRGEGLPWWKAALLLLACIPIAALLYLLAILLGAPFLLLR